MKRILFFIPNLMHGGAEKVLVNLVNNMNHQEYDITVMTIFDVGIHKASLSEKVNYKYIFKRLFRGSTTLFKLFSPRFLFKRFVKDEYDIVVAYLEGPSARIISGCDNPKTKKVAWIHIELDTPKSVCKGFRSYDEMSSSYNSFDKIIAVSEEVKKVFEKNAKPKQPLEVLYNTNETDIIIERSKEIVDDLNVKDSYLNICSVAKIEATKGYDRLIKVHGRLANEGYKINCFILGIGSQTKKLEHLINENNLQDSFKFIGFRENPYKYVKQADFYVCSSRREGFSTAVTEALVIGIPVLSTNCSGAYELLGYDNEYGIVVENSEAGLYKGLKWLLDNSEIIDDYRNKARQRGQAFTKEKTVKSVEDMFNLLLAEDSITV